jgi:bifunctional UDP-N-acetylglucosamine pyrophosphorylase/glucosamine-1-phosphate N-acetyltransferase
MQQFVAAGVAELVVVLSPSQPEVSEIVSEFSKTVSERCRILPVFQEVALGTGHAALCGVRALESVGRLTGTTLIGLGDVPGISSEILNELALRREVDKSSLTVLAFNAANPHGYGRVLKNSIDQVVAIQEEKDCSPEQRLVTSCNSGFFAGDLDNLREFLPKIKQENAAREFYLTDLPALLTEAGRRVSAYEGVAEDVVLGINSQQQLADAAVRMQRRVVSLLLESGVQILNPEQVYIEPTVTFGKNVIVEPFVKLSGNVHIPDDFCVPSFSRWSEQSDVQWRG